MPAAIGTRPLKKTRRMKATGDDGAICYRPTVAVYDRHNMSVWWPTRELIGDTLGIMLHFRQCAHQVPSNDGGLPVQVQANGTAAALVSLMPTQCRRVAQGTDLLP
jgi:hypothetical protein